MHAAQYPIFSGWRLFAFIVISAIIATVGCGKQTPTGPTPFPVRGTVTYQGKPAAGFVVIFHPISPSGTATFIPSGMTDANGRYHLHVYGDVDGAPAGKYSVTFEWPEKRAADPNDIPVDVDRLKGRFANVGKTPFKATVREGENEIETFHLK